MPRKVAIVGVAQTKHGVISGSNVREMVYDVTQAVLENTGLRPPDIDTVVTSSSDYWQGISCSNSFYFEAAASYLKDSSKAEEDSALGFIYAYMRVLSGHHDTALVVGVTKGSEIPSSLTLTNLYADPFFQRPVGLEDLSTSALQAKLYMERYGITEEQCAQVVVKNLGNARLNPYAHRKQKLTVDDVMKSKAMASPIKELDCAPASDGACALILASEERSKKITDKPAWIKGVGWSSDEYYVGDRDLLDGSLERAARMAYRQAGITQPHREINVAEVCEPFSFQELLWCEHLGLFPPGGAGHAVERGVTALGGKLPVNPSGGVLSTNPFVARGAIRIAEAALQVMGKAGKHQVDKANTAVAHSVHGLAGQLHSVVVLGK